MEIAFKASFVAAVVAEVVLVAVLVLQVWRRERHGSTGPLVFTAGDVAAAAALFGGAMTVTALFADGWDVVLRTDTLLYAVTFGIVTAAATARLRRGGRGSWPARARAALLLPLGAGVLAGLAGV